MFNIMIEIISFTVDKKNFYIARATTTNKKSSDCYQKLLNTNIYYLRIIDI